MDVGYFRRIYGNFTVTDNRAVAADRLQPVQHHRAGRSAAARTAAATRSSGLYNLNPNKVGQVDNYVTFADNFGKQIEHWNGVDVTVNARPGSGVLLQGGMSTGRTSTDNCEVRAQVPENSARLNPFCHVDTKFLTQVKLLGTYTVPKVDVQVAATFQSLPGPQITANYIALERRWCSRRSAGRSRAAPPT